MPKHSKSRSTLKRVQDKSFDVKSFDIALDKSFDVALDKQDEIFRKMTPGRRLHIAGEMYDFAKKIIASEDDTIYDRIRKASYKNRGRT